MPAAWVTEGHWLALLVALPAAGACLAAFLERDRRPRTERSAHKRPREEGLGAAQAAFIGGIVSTAAAAALLTAAWLHLGGRHGIVTTSLPWVPSLGINFDLTGDRLSCFFAGAAILLGSVVIAYAASYFGGTEHIPRGFLPRMLAFIAAMVGAVLANNILLTYVFWELTSLASFLLIGTHSEDRNARIAARRALLTTFATGLPLLAGLILLGQTAGTWLWSDALADTAWSAKPVTTVAMSLILIGAMGKSAQIPFHAWLKGAMVAPTPVSALLHSATMVKLGVYLVARLHPALSTLHEWDMMLLIWGWASMLVAGALALFAQDIKAALALTTISALGYLIGLYGTNAAGTAEIDVVHIGNHALYKAGLFTLAGTVIHLTGERDLRKLGGLARTQPILAATCAILLASMIGLPGTLGFVSKEEIITGLLESDHRFWLLAAFSAGTVLKVIFAARFFSVVFLGRSDRMAISHTPGLTALLPPVFASLMLILFGIVPEAMQPLLGHDPGLGWHATSPGPLAAWHGFNVPFAISSGIVLVGAGLFLLAQKMHLFSRAKADARRPASIRPMQQAARTTARTICSLSLFNRPAAHLQATLCVLMTAGVCLYLAVHLAPVTRLGELSTFAPAWRWLLGALVALASLGVALFRLWTTQLLSLSVAGFLLCIYFAIFRAPDLALTQVLVEVLLLVLYVFLLARFPRSAQRGENAGKSSLIKRAGRPLVAVAAGLGTTVLLLFLTHPARDHALGHKLLEASLEKAESRNAVNAILVDFRGLDTLGESSVLLIALLGSLGLFMRRRRGSDHRRRKRHRGSPTPEATSVGGTTR